MHLRKFLVVSLAALAVASGGAGAQSPSDTLQLDLIHCAAHSRLMADLLRANGRMTAVGILHTRGAAMLAATQQLDRQAGLDADISIATENLIYRAAYPSLNTLQGQKDFIARYKSHCPTKLINAAARILGIKQRR